MKQLRLSSYQEPTSVIPNLVRLLELAGEGYPAASAAKRLGVQKQWASYWYRRFQALKLLKLEGTHPKMPVLLVSVSQAVDFLQGKGLLSVGMKPIGKPPNSTNVVGMTSGIRVRGDYSGMKESAADVATISTQYTGGASPSPSVALAGPTAFGGASASKGSSNGPFIRSPFPLPFWSAHRLTVRFGLRGRLPSTADRHGKNGRSYWYLRDLGEEFKGVTIEGGRKSVLVKVFGVPGGQSVERVKLAALQVASKAVVAWAGRYGARLEAQGELVGRAEWVLEDKVLSKAVIGLLNLEKQAKTFESVGGLAEWSTDNSHKGLVEVKGDGSETQIGNFNQMVSGVLTAKLDETRAALVELGEKTGELAGEVKRIAEVLTPPSSPILPKTPRNWRDLV